MNDQKKGGMHYGFVMVIALSGIILTTMSFTWSCAGIFFPSVTKFLAVGKGPFALYLSVICLFMFLTLPFAGKFFALYSARTVLLLSVLLTVVTFIGMSMAQSLYHFYIAGVFLGISQGFIQYLAVPTLIGRWFKERVGFFIGVCASMSGVGGIIFNPIAAKIITDYGWRMGYLSFAIATAVIAIPCALLIAGFPSDKGLKAYGEDTAADAPVIALEGVSYSDAVKSPAFWVLLPFAFFVAFVTNVNFYLPSYAMSLGLSLTIGATVASSSMMGVMIGKILLGYVNDKSIIGGFVFCFGGGIVGLGSMLFFGQFGAWVLVPAAVLYGFSYAGVNVQSPMTARKIVGNRDYPQIYAKIAMAMALSSTIGSNAWGFISDATGGFSSVFMIAIVILALAFVLGMVALQTGKKLVFTTADGKVVKAF
ncbi:MAG: MFS transporter [Smithellaceae bacterium]